jgi:hypothetical protein
MKKVWYGLFIALFFMLCLIPSLGLAVQGPADPAANEAPAVAPSVKNYDGTWNSSYLTDLRDYVGNAFYGRLECITGWDTLCAKVFKTSANDDVILGPDGWLFYGTAVNDITGSNQMTDRQIWAAARSLALIQEYVESQGAQFVFTVPCGKYTLYPSHVPSYVTVAEGSNRQRLMVQLEAQGVNYANLYEAFSQVDEELYWQWDSHWNAKGAALAADTILAAADIDSDYFNGPFDEEVNHSGDLYAMLFPTGSALETDYVWSAGYHFDYTSNFNSSDDISITTENAQGSGSLLMFRDSSGRNLYPYMAETFATARFSRLNNYRLDFMAEQQPDVVVVELAERTLNYILKYPAVYPAPERESAVLDTVTAVDSEITADTSGSTMADYAKVTGTLPETAVDSPVYLVADGTVYEAMPDEGAFTAWLPMDTNVDALQVYIAQP